MTEENPMNAKEDGAIIGYMCLTDFECELGGSVNGTLVFPSPDDCRYYRKCITGCGMVEVEVRARRIVQEPQR